MATKISKNNYKILGFSILLLVVILCFFAFSKFVNKSSENDTIKSIVLSEECVASIKLKSGKTEIIDIESGVISKECKIKPVVSRDGKYAAFDLNLVIKDSDQKSGKSANNSSIVYKLDSDKWINVYNHGAGEATSLKFNDNNDLVIDIRYEGKDQAPWTVKNSDFNQILETEEKMAIGLTKRDPELALWLKKFDSKSYLSKNKEGKAVVEIDRYDGDTIIIHAYEQFLTDGHRATFNWYSYSRPSFLVTKEF
ncbi:MAG: hypothetical protein WA152_00475 [Microgenomates group bacterium]